MDNRFWSECYDTRPNPYPEVMDLFYRLPLSTLFYQLEAVHLGDLLRLSVQPGVRITPSRGFSWDVESAPEPVVLEGAALDLSCCISVQTSTTPAKLQSVSIMNSCDCPLEISTISSLKVYTHFTLKPGKKFSENAVDDAVWGQHTEYNALTYNFRSFLGSPLDRNNITIGSTNKIYCPPVIWNEGTNPVMIL